MSEEITEYYAEDLLPSGSSIPNDIAEEFPALYPKVLNLLMKGDDLSGWELIKEAQLDAEDETRIWSEAKEESHAQRFLQAHPEYVPNAENWSLVQAELRNRRLTEANLADAWFRVQQKQTKQSTGQADEFTNLSNEELKQALADVRAEMKRRK